MAEISFEGILFKYVICVRYGAYERRMTVQKHGCK